MSTTLVTHGVLHPNGWIQLLDPTDLPSEPCEVDLSLTVLKPATSESVPPTKPAMREPDGFWPDESITAPFDLPRYGTPRPIVVRKATGPYLPDPVFIAVGEEVLE